MSKLLLSVILFLFYVNAFAQIEISGLVDVEVSSGGADSDFGVNEIAADFKDTHLAINQFNIFLFSQITESFYVDARLQFDTWGTGRLNPVRLSLAEIVWAPAHANVQLAFGRFVNPFGLYPQRQLSIQNLFVNTPLAYGYAVNITNQQGIVYYTDGTAPAATYGGAYGEDTGKLTTISFSGYTTGAMLSWLIVPEVFNIDLAITNAAVASQKNYTNRGNYGGIARLGFQPTIFWQQGVSFSYGGFMEQSAFSDSLGDLSKYKQTVLGADWVISFGYFELSGEFVHSTWKAPAVTQDSIITDSYGKAKAFELTNYSYYVDLKYEPSFLPGSYFAVRYEEMRFKEYDSGSTYYGAQPVKYFESLWDNNIRRWSAAIGYKFSPDIQLKIAYSDQKLIDVNTDLDAYTVRSILSASF